VIGEVYRVLANRRSN